QLLAFARRSPLNPEVIDPAARIRAMHDLLDRSLREDIVVDLRLPSGLWPIEVDPSQLEVAVLNIALNARDVMPDGGTIVIDGENIPDTQCDMVRLSISDSGKGVPPETIAKVFDPFFTTKGVGQGTGLGLSQVYGFARSSGGEAHFTSEIGTGSTVSLLIPRSPKPLPRPAVSAESAVAAVQDHKQILLVEDDDSVAEMVGDMLKELGYGVDRVPTADSALDTLMAARGFDLVLSDMMMPGKLNGLDLAHAVTQNWPKLPVILMTGYSAAAASAAKEGIRLLVKPYRMEDLSAELQSALA
ncbi:MAG: integral rane sensor hybrid histidine kinase, partial [Rhizorhabdus sp.]|nr:integral rane sensor hybrid histidine kinase [Rhizorhabdus sp.]